MYIAMDLLWKRIELSIGCIYNGQIKDIKQQSVEHRSTRDYLLHFIFFALLKEPAYIRMKKELVV